MPADLNTLKSLDAVAERAATIGRKLAVRKAAEAAENAVGFIIRVMDDEDAALHVRLKAAESILDRALGKPKQEINQEVNLNVTHVHLEAVKALNAQVIEHDEAEVIADQAGETHQVEGPRAKAKGFDGS